MPRKPGLPKKRSTVSLSWQQTLGLIQPIPISVFRFKNDEERREAWENNRVAIMELQGKKFPDERYGKPLRRDCWFDFFERPEAFYRYDLKENCCGKPENQKEFLIKKNLLNAHEKRLLRSETA
ncbi:MAG: hypothetical protein KAU38_11880 [Desulfobacterales bacterium]|nr:hypothetical protein [Desulfobacterales bacterium]